MFAHSPIIVPCRDALVHTDEHPYCSDSTCPCHDKPPQDEIILTMPTEEALDEQEKSVLRPFDISRELAQIRNVTHWCIDGWW